VLCGDMSSGHSRSVTLPLAESTVAAVAFTKVGRASMGVLTHIIQPVDLDLTRLRGPGTSDAAAPDRTAL